MEKVSLEKELVAKLKLSGVEIAEDAALVVLDAVLDYAGKKVIESENKFDDMLIAILPLIRAELHKLADGIDGKKD